MKLLLCGNELHNKLLNRVQEVIRVWNDMTVIKSPPVLNFSTAVSQMSVFAQTCGVGLIWAHTALRGLNITSVSSRHVCLKIVYCDLWSNISSQFSALIYPVSWERFENSQLSSSWRPCPERALISSVEIDWGAVLITSSILIHKRHGARKIPEEGLL